MVASIEWSNEAADPQMAYSPFPSFVTALLSLSIILLVLWPKFVVIPGINANPFTVVQVAIFLISPYIFFKSWSRSTRYHAASRLLIVILLTVMSALELVATLSGGPDASLETFVRVFLTTKIMFFVGLGLGSLGDTLQRVRILMFWLFGLSFLVAIGEQLAQVRALALVADFFPSSGNDIITSMSQSNFRDGELRSGALFDNPIILAVASGLAVPFGLSALTARNGASKFGAMIFIILAAVAGYVSYSRTFFVAIAASGGTYILLRLLAMVRTRNWALGFALLALIPTPLALLAPLMLEIAAGRTGLESYSSSLRQVMWDRAMPYIYQRPILGWGAGSDGVYAGIKVTNVVTVDDSYLTIVVNAGLATLGVLLVASAVAMYRAMVTGASIFRLESKMSAVVASGIVCVLICQKSNSIPAPFSYLYMFLGVLASDFRPSPSGRAVKDDEGLDGLVASA